MSQNPNRMRLSESIRESERRGGEIENLVFKSGIKLRWTKKDSAVTFCILPAMPRDQTTGFAIKSDYVAYRDEEDYFTEWVSVFKQHRTIGRKLDILSPQVFQGSSVEDPVDILFDTAKSDPRFYSIICKNPSDGKFHRDAYKLALLRQAEWRCIMNTIDPAERENPNAVSLMVVPRTAIFKKGYVILPEKEGASSSSGAMWGLADMLDQYNRNVPAGTPQHDFDSRFYWGDITNPVIDGRSGGLAVCSIRTEPTGVAGGIDPYNCRVTEAARIQGNMEMLEARYDFENDVFVRLTEEEYLDRVINALRGTADQLMFAAWNNRGPQYQAALSRAGIASGNTTVQGVNLPRRPADTHSRVLTREEDESDEIPGIPPSTPVARHNSLPAPVPARPALARGDANGSEGVNGEPQSFTPSAPRQLPQPSSQQGGEFLRKKRIEDKVSPQTSQEGAE